MARARMQIAIGDLFRKTNSTNWIWQVENIFTPTGHSPHARLSRSDFSSDTRIFSLSALKDTRLFVPVGHLIISIGDRHR